MRQTMNFTAKRARLVSELLRMERPGSLHSRKLRSFVEVAFQ